MFPGGAAGDEGTASTRLRAARIRRTRIPELPDPSGDLVLRPHTVGALGVELTVAAVGLVVAVDGMRHGSVPAALLGLGWALVVGGAGLLAFRRSTRLDASGVSIQHPFSIVRLPWSGVRGFEVLPHQRGRRDRIVVLTDHGVVAMPHGDSRSLALRPELSRQWYEAVSDRLEAVRRRYV